MSVDGQAFPQGDQASRSALRDRYQELRKNVKGKDVLIRILFRATRMLFYELYNEVKG